MIARALESRLISKLWSAVTPSTPVVRPLRCPGCAATYEIAVLPGAVLACVRCGTGLISLKGKSIDAALACSAATLILLIPANLLPFLETSLLGVSRTSWLGSSATVMWRDGWPWLGLAIGTFVVLAPLVRFALLTTVLAVVKFGWRPGWLGHAFRLSETLQPWAMPDVFLLGLWIAYARLRAAVFVTVHAGALCFIIAGILTLLTRAVLPTREVWNQIKAEPDVPIVAAIACRSCELAHPASAEGGRCDRCGDALLRRRAGALEYAAALTIGGMILYVIANVYPMATMPMGLTPSSYTVLEGAIDLLKAHLFPLALLVLTVSFAVPLMKLAGMGWFVVSVLRGSQKHLRFKTKLYHVIEEVGRWSMVDPFVIACFVPVMQYNSLIYGKADGAATAFTAVVIATMVAARCFDPRMFWDRKTEAA